MKTRGRARTRSGIFLLGLAAALVAGVSLKRPLVEEWCIRRLESESPDERRAAARRLGAMRSTRAIPHLIRGVRRAKPYYGERFQVVVPSTEAFVKGLIAIGEPALPAIRELLSDGDPEVVSAAEEMLRAISPARLEGASTVE